LALDMVLRAAAKGNELALGIAAAELDSGSGDAARRALVLDVLLKAAGDGSATALKLAMAFLGAAGDRSSDRIHVLRAAMRAAAVGHTAAVEVVAAALKAGADVVLERHLLESLQRAAMSGSTLALDLAVERLDQLSSGLQHDLFGLLARMAQRGKSRAFDFLMASAEHPDPKVRAEAVKALGSIVPAYED